MKFKRILCFMLAAVTLVGFTACNKATSPRDAVDRFVVAMNKKDFRAAFAYIADYDSFGFSGGTEDIIGAVASSMKAEFLGESAGSTGATVDVNITTVDLREIYMSAAAKVIPSYYEAAVSGRTISEAEIGERLIDEVVAEAGMNSAPTVTTKVSLQLIKSDSGKWQIRLDNDAYYAITGYLDEANNLVTTGMILNAITNNGGQQPLPPVVQPPVSSSDAVSSTDI